MKTKSLFAALLITLLPQMAHSDDKFRVGVILPLTGPLAEYGVAEKNGIELAIADKPELFNHIQFSFEDSRYDPKTALSAFTNLRARFNPQLVYDWGAATGTALAPVAEGQKFPLLSMAIDGNVAKDKKYVIRFGNHAKEYIEAIVPYLRKHGFKKLAIVNVELAYTNSMVRELTAQMSQPGEEVRVLASVNPGDSDFKTIVAKLRREKFDALGVYLMSGQVGEFFRLLKQQQLTPPTFGTDFFESIDEIKTAEGAMNGTVYPHNPVPTDFYTRYLATYKNDSQVAYAINGYDFATLIGREFNDSGTKLSGDEILTKLESTPPQNGQVGPYEFKNDPQHGKYFDFPIVLKTIINNKVEELK